MQRAANILIDNHVAKIADFGISVTLDSESEGQANAGSLMFPWRYAAPEIVIRTGEFEKATTEADIWSYGYDS